MGMGIIKFSKLAGVSVATVSRAFTGRGRISKKTAERIRRLAADHGFAPNVHASRFRSRESKTVGLIFLVNRDNPCDYYSLELIQAVSRAILEAGYAVSLMIFEEQRDQLFQGMANGGAVDGVILGADPSYSGEAFEKMLGGLPAVLLGGDVEQARTAVGAVGIEFVESVSFSISYLASLGHKRIGLIRGVGDEGKYQGYRKGLAKAGLPFDGSLVVKGGCRFEDGATAMTKLLAQRTVTSVFACTDILAMGAISSIKEAGLDVPRDLSVIGFDDLAFVSYLNPPLTTLRINLSEVGTMAVRILKEIIECRKLGRKLRASEAASRHYGVVTPTLMKRGTVEPCRSA